MPAILRCDGLRVVIYPNDHLPEHVHVIGSDGEALFNLQCPHGPVRLRENYGFSRAQIARIAAELLPRIRMLCDEWS